MPQFGVFVIYDRKLLFFVQATEFIYDRNFLQHYKHISVVIDDCKWWL